MELKVHTCDVRYADTDGEVMVQADGGAWEPIDNPGNDRERDQSDTYVPCRPRARRSRSRPTSSDGWSARSS